MSLRHRVRPFVAWLKSAQDRAGIYVSTIKFLLNLYEIIKICVGAVIWVSGYLMTIRFHTVVKILLNKLRGFGRDETVEESVSRNLQNCMNLFKRHENLLWQPVHPKCYEWYCNELLISKNCLNDAFSHLVSPQNRQQPVQSRGECLEHPSWHARGTYCCQVNASIATISVKLVL